MNAAASHTRIFDTAEELAEAAADWIVEQARATARRFALCLSGGSTPKRLYELLAAPTRLARFPWQRAHFFWGDERFVAHDDPRSNFQLAWNALLRHAPIAPDHIHPIPTDAATAEAAAAAYDSTLKRFYGADLLDPMRPLFDLTLLGLGEDGHTASLFPESPVLSEQTRWVAPVIGESAVERITLTYPALASSLAIGFVVAGKRKREALARVRAGDQSLPAARLRPIGDVYWFIDRAAASTPAFSGK